jgi:hypothetical protein
MLSWILRLHCWVGLGGGAVRTSFAAGATAVSHRANALSIATSKGPARVRRCITGTVHDKMRLRSPDQASDVESEQTRSRYLMLPA